jgi:hypothetical protein
VQLFYFGRAAGLFLLLTIGLWAAGCADSQQPGQPSEPDSIETQDGEQGSEPSVESSSVLEVAAEHRTCSDVGDCGAVYINCSACDGGCEGVNTQFETAYSEALECEGFDGPECDYDCHPSAGLTELLCDDGLCVIRPL